MKPLAKIVGNFLFPPTCQGCGERVFEVGTICFNCWQDIHFITPPYCPIMGTPFQFDPGQNFLSGEALQNPPAFDKLRSAVIHDGLARLMVARLKYGDRIDSASFMARWMVNAAQDILCETDLIIPIPLHRWRFFKRQYNQAAELARIISALTELPFISDVLFRHKATRHQVGLHVEQRKRNVAGAFSVPSHMAKKIHNKNIVLVDDVYTTGATVNVAAKCLKKSGAAHIFVLTYSRVLVDHNSDPSIDLKRI